MDFYFLAFSSNFRFNLAQVDDKTIEVGTSDKHHFHLSRDDVET